MTEKLTNIALVIAILALTAGAVYQFCVSCLTITKGGTVPLPEVAFQSLMIVAAIVAMLHLSDRLKAKNAQEEHTDTP